MAETLTCITNNTMHFVHLPPVGSKFGGGIRLIPGLNRIPDDYLTQANAYARPVADQYGKVRTTLVERKRTIKVTEEKTGKETSKEVTEAVEEPVMRFPLRKQLERFFKVPVRLITSQGKSIGPMLTLHKDGEIDDRTPLGPPPPDELPGTDGAALFIVNNTVSKEALSRWAAFDQRELIRNACMARMGTV